MEDKKRSEKIKDGDFTFATATIAHISDLFIGNQANVYAYTSKTLRYVCRRPFVYTVYLLFMQFKFKFDDDDKLSFILCF